MVHRTMCSFDVKQQLIIQSWNKEEFYDSNGVNRIRKSKAKQHNSLTQRDERTKQRST